MKTDIVKLVAYYARKFETRDPFKIAQALNIEVQIGELGSKSGCYMFLKNHRCIFLNENLEEHEMRFVMAHELAHAILHRKQNCYFIRNKTFLSTSKIEKEANKFAAQLLISEDVIFENKDLTAEQLSRLLGYDEKVIALRLSK